jgi:ABC-type sugar transport system permease subunit
VDDGRRRSLRLAALLGTFYTMVGVTFAWPSTHAIAWRFAAWVVSAAAYGAHVTYEHFTLRNSPLTTALHASAAVAVGATGLALAGMVHDLSTTSTIRRAWLFAVVALPAVTAVPAFVFAFIAAVILNKQGWPASARSSADRLS